MEFKIEIVDADDVKVLKACDGALLTKILHRGIKDYFYRKEHNKKNLESLKEFTRLKREAGLKGMTVAQMIASAKS